MTEPKPADQPSAAKILSREMIFDGYHKLEMFKVQPRSLRHGGWCEPMEREVLFGKRIASVLLYVPDTDHLLLNQQFRLGAMLAGAEDPFLFETAAGAVDDGESVEEAACREALEETGCEIRELEYFGKVYSSPGCLAEEFHMFVGCIDAAESGIYGHEEEGEEIKTHLLPIKSVLKMLDEGRIVNVTTALALNWFARNHQRLREKWRKT